MELNMGDIKSVNKSNLQKIQTMQDKHSCTIAKFQHPLFRLMLIIFDRWRIYKNKIESVSPMGLLVSGLPTRVQALSYFIIIRQLSYIELIKSESRDRVLECSGRIVRRVPLHSGRNRSVTLAYPAQSDTASLRHFSQSFVNIESLLRIDLNEA